jgi:predicted SprT family Zn-dependent metalloprotease
MFIYDSTSVAFIQKCENLLREILTEANIKVRTTRFEFNRYLYPINVVVFEGKEWGHFNSQYLQIALNRKLIYQAKDSVVRDVLRHELAHYLTYVSFGDVRAHGPEFLSVCEKLGLPSDVSAATMNLEESNEAKIDDAESERVLEKVKKLLSLAQSSNTHEAQLATIKANELLLKHNLTFVNNPSGPIYLDRLLPRKRKDSKLTAIYSILKHFIVRPVISQGKGTCCLEVSGSLTNVKLATYVATFLDRELDQMWRAAQDKHGLGGMRAKNSFFHGIAEGFDQKMKDSKMNFSEQDRKALTIVERKLDFDTLLIYKRLGTSHSTNHTDNNARGVGHQKGLALTINTALEANGKLLYLPSR